MLQWLFSQIRRAASDGYDGQDTRLTVRVNVAGVILAIGVSLFLSCLGLALVLGKIDASLVLENLIGNRASMTAQASGTNAGVPVPTQSIRPLAKNQTTGAAQ